MSKNNSIVLAEHSARTIIISSINDLFRQTFNKNFGIVNLSAEVSQLNRVVLMTLLKKVREDKVLYNDNDPYKEHDFGTVNLLGNKFYWKIDYYDNDLEYLSEDPTDINITKRVLTIMSSSEY